jgi:hypothetical protein
MLGFRQYIINESNVEQIANNISIKCDKKGSCVAFGELVNKALQAQGITDFYIVEGYVTFENDKSGKMQHTWLEYQSKIIDPTLVQFNGWDLKTVVYKIKKKYTPVQYDEVSQKHPINVKDYQ